MLGTTWAIAFWNIYLLFDILRLYVNIIFCLNSYTFPAVKIKHKQETAEVCIPLKFAI